MPLLVSPRLRKPMSYWRMSVDSSEDVTEDAHMLHKEEEGDPFPEHQHFHPHRSRFPQICGYLVVGIVAFIVGSIGSQFLRVEYEPDSYPAPYGSTSRLTNIIWNANASFADDLSELTDAAWNSLIPKGRGFVIHSSLTPAGDNSKKEKSVSVFHELHCLHGIRTALYTTAYLLRKERALTNTSNESASSHDHPAIPAFIENPYLEATLKGDGAHHLEPHHLAHCFDYIRQALMCAADSNLEDVVTMNDENGEPLTGAEGWGSKRVCRDFWGLWEWSEKWRSREGGGIN